MTENRLPLAELMAKAGDGDFLRSVAEAVVQLLMETDVDGLIGAGRHERTGDRTTYRNGYRAIQTIFKLIHYIHLNSCYPGRRAVPFEQGTEARTVGR